jgi:hypothetical protein
MIILNRDGTLEWVPVDCRASEATTDAFELPADLVAQPSNLFDQIFALAFDVLGLVTIELRVRATGQETLRRAE